MKSPTRLPVIITACLWPGLAGVAAAQEGLPQMVVQSRDAQQRVTALAFSPDGKTLVTGDSAGQIAIYDANTGLIFNSFGRHAQPVLDVTVTDDRSAVVSVGSVNTEIADDTYVELAELIHWDGRDGARRDLIAGDRTLRSPSHLLLDGASRYCLSGSDMGQGFFVRGATAGGAPETKLDLEAMLKRRTPDSGFGTIAGISGCGDLGVIERFETLELWDLNRQVFIADITPANTELAGQTLAQFSADQSTIAIFNQFGPLLVLDVASRRWLFQTDDFEPGYQSGRAAVAVSPDGAFVAYPTRPAEDRYEAALWSRAANAAVHRLAYSASPVEPGETAGFVALAFSPDGQTLATGDALLRLWDVATGRLRRNMSADVGVAEIKATAIAQDRRSIVLGGSKNGKPLLQKLDLIDGTTTSFEGHAQPVSALALVEGGQRTWLVSGSADGILMVHDAATSLASGTLQLDGIDIRSLAVAADGQHVAVAGGGVDDGRAVIVEIAAGVPRLQCELWAGEGPITKARYYSDGTLLLGLTNYSQEARPGANGSYELDSKPVITRFAVEGCSDQQDAAGQTRPATAVAMVNFEDFSYSLTSAFGEDPADGSVVFATHYVDRRGTSLFRWKDGAVTPYRSVFVDVPETPVGRLHDDEPVVAIDFADDGSLLVALGAGRGSFILERPGEGAVRIDTGTGALSDAYFSADGKVFVTVAGDGSLSFWDTAGATKLLTIFSFGARDDFLFVTRENHYWTTQSAVLALAFRSGQDIFPFQQFDLRFNRPDKVLEQIGAMTGMPQSDRVALYRRAFAERLAAVGVAEQDLGGTLHLPDTPKLVTLVPGTTEARSIDLVFSLGARGETIRSAVAMVNGVPLAPASLTFEGEGAGRQLKVPVPLSDGANNVRVSVIDESGAESLAASVGTDRQGERQPRDLYVLVIGASSYADSSRNLDFPAKDAEDVAAALAEGNGAFDRVHVTRLIDADVTRDKVRALKDTLAASTVNDTVVVYYAGHGMLSQDLRYYLATFDTDFGNPAGAALAYDELAGLLEDIPARNKLLLMDACHSGELSSEAVKLPAADAAAGDGGDQSGHVIFRGETGRGAEAMPRLAAQQSAFDLMKTLFTDIRRRSGATVIASAGAGEFAYEGPAWSNGVFTYALRTALSTGAADSSGDGRVDVRELKSYLQAQVFSLTQGRQQPTVRDENPENVFVLR